MSTSNKNTSILEKKIKNDYYIDSSTISSNNILLAIKKTNKKIYVIKKIIKKKHHLANREIKILSKINHPNIVKLINYYKETQTQSINLVLSYCCNGDLFDYLKKKRYIKEDIAKKFFKQIANAVKYLHNKDIIHRDIKPENLALDSSFNIKLIDFGLSVVSKKPLKTIKGTIEYMAPEVFYKNYYKECDIWSIGITLYECLCGSLPFQGINNDIIIDKILKIEPSYIEKMWKHISLPAIKLIKSLLIKNVSRRASIDDFIFDEWFISAYHPKYK